MFTLIVAVIIVGVAVVCDCISDCVRYRYKYQNTCCDTCPYRDECLEVCGDE